MSIKRVADFATKVFTAVDMFEKNTGRDVNTANVQELILKFGDLAFKEITDLWNWIFSYKNPDYAKATKAWICDNVSIRILTEVVKQIAIQNKLDWLGPFIRGKIMENLKTAMS